MTVPPQPSDCATAGNGAWSKPLAVCMCTRPRHHGLEHLFLTSLENAGGLGRHRAEVEGHPARVPRMRPQRRGGLEHEGAHRRMAHRQQAVERRDVFEAPPRPLIGPILEQASPSIRQRISEEPRQAIERGIVMRICAGPHRQRERR